MRGVLLVPVILALLQLTSCGPRKPPVQPAELEPIPQPQTLLADPSYIVVFVNEEGSLFVGEEAVTEEQLVEEARTRLLDNPDMKAVLYVSSSQIQGIHLTILFSEAGYKNVVVYYPTASPPR
jgi:hypothetical protein